MDDINSFLHFSYIPNCTSGLPDNIERATQPSTNSIEFDISTGLADALLLAIDKNINESNSDVDHIVPLSSGLDSRAILAGLLAHHEIQKSNIQTISFGSPGTWDFEIGKRVADQAGVSNIAIDLTDESFDWSLRSIRKYAATQDSPTRILDGYINSVIPSLIDNNAVIWSGFMGDPSVGAHQPENPTEDWDAACEQFANNEQYSTGLSGPNFDPTSILPDNPFIARDQLTYEEQLDFALRQQCLIKPIVIQSDQYKTPFIDQDWLKFSLNLPRKYRRNRKLFKETLLAEFPELFSIPTDANAGLKLSSHPIRRWIRGKRLGLTSRLSSLLNIPYVHPGTNYIDFATEFRTEGELRDTVHTLLKDFSERDLTHWINPHQIWEDHQNGRNRTNDIRVISSLELYLRS